MVLVADRVTAAHPGLSIGRVGRDSVEFAFIASDRPEAEAILRAVADQLARPLELDGLDLTLSATVAAANLGTGPIQDASVDQAAAALVEARRRHKPVLVTDATSEPVPGVDGLTLLREMPEAMRSGALQVHYQPKLRVRSNRIDAAEALIRWTHPTVGPVAIEPFIRLAEETGSIGRLTEWVIARAVLDRATMSAAGVELTIWVNLSGRLLADAVFTARALELIEGSGGGLGLEITETAVIDNPARAMANLADFARAGVRIAIDDYGSGLSSLAYLQQLPANELKIDRAFIKGLVTSHRDPLIVRSSIDLAHALEMEVTAEGVDDAMALALLKIMGCDMVQGYLISHPEPLPRLLGVIRDIERLDRLAAPDQIQAWRRQGQATNRG
jgi:diguanylate cyclase